MEDELIAAIREMINLEKELESSKIQLILKSDFNMHDAFAIFDFNKDGSVQMSELREGLSAIGVYPTNEEVELFFLRHDQDKNMSLQFKEFFDAFTPHDVYYAHMLQRRNQNMKQPVYRRDDCFFADTAVEFRNMWRIHFKVEAQTE